MIKQITFFISSLRMGGAEQVCVTVANGLANRGWAVTVVVLNLDDAVLAKHLADDVTLHNLGYRHARTAIRSIFRYLNLENPRAILVFNHQLAVLCVAIRFITRKRFAIIARSINNLSEKRHREPSSWHKYVVGNIVKYFFRKADFFVAQCNAMSEDLVRKYSVNPNRCTVIYNPINASIESFSDIALREGSEDYILCVGKLTAQKAFHYAIRAFSEVSVTFPALRLKIIGDGEQRSELEKLVESLGLRDKVSFLGRQRNVASFMVNAKMTLLTSIYEGLPNVLLESIAVGTPVVAFDCRTGPAEIIIEEVNGFLVPLENLELLSRGIHKAMVTPWDKSQISLTAEVYKSEHAIRAYERVALDAHRFVTEEPRTLNQ